MYKEKLKQIIKIMEENHIDMYFNISKDELEKYMDQFFSENKIHDEYEFYYFANVVIKKIFGIYDSHTKLEWNNADFNLPFRFKYMNNKLYILRTTEEYKELLYSEVLRINDIAISQLVHEIKDMTVYSTNEYLEFIIEITLCNIFKLRSLPSISNKCESFDFEILKDDKVITKKLEKQKEKLLSVNKMPDNYTYKILDDKLYIVYNACREEYENQMLNFVDQIKEKSMELNIDKFIVDIRGNQGGNSEIIKPLIEFLENKNIITLVDKYVFSSGRFSIVSLKQIGSKFVGTGIGTMLNCFGNTVNRYHVDPYILPICDKYFYFDEEKCKMAGVDSKEDFLKLKKNEEIFIPQIFEPDYYVQNTMEDYRIGVDKEFETAIEILNNKDNIEK